MRSRAPRHPQPGHAGRLLRGDGVPHIAIDRARIGKAGAHRVHHLAMAESEEAAAEERGWIGAAGSNFGARHQEAAVGQGVAVGEDTALQVEHFLGRHIAVGNDQMGAVHRRALVARHGDHRQPRFVQHQRMPAQPSGFDTVTQQQVHDLAIAAALNETNRPLEARFEMPLPTFQQADLLV